MSTKYQVAGRVERVMAAKSEAGVSFDEIATHMGVTNTYASQLCLGQAKLVSDESAEKLSSIAPGISQEDLVGMRTEFPVRSFDDEILKEPNIYRTYEAILHTMD